MKLLASIAHKEGFSIQYTATLSDAMACMLENKNGSVVLLKHGHPVGMVTEGLIISLLDELTDFTQPVMPLATTPVITANENRPVESAFDLVVTNNIRRLVLVNDEGNYSGMVLQEDLFGFLEEDVYKVDLKVVDLLTHDSNVITVKQGKRLHDVLDIMHRANIGSVIVTDANGEAVGIVTEKDILSAGYHRVNLAGYIETLMSSPVLAVSTQDAITDVIEIMRRTGIRRVLVRETDGSMRALLTNRDIFKHIKGNVARMLEIKLRHAKEIMDLLPEAIIEIFDVPGYQVIHWMNRKAKKHFGEGLLEQSPQALLGETWIDLYSALEKNGQIENFSALVGGRNFEFSGILSKNLNSRYVKLIAKDVTEHEIMKQQLQDEVSEEIRLRQEQEYLMMQQSRLASMGEMIGHIAHQWRQPLAQLGGIFMNLESAQAFDELDEAYLQKKITHGNAMIKYMSQTIDDFRLFFTPNENTEPFDVVLALRQAINIVSAGLDYHHIKVKLDAKPGNFFAKEYASEFAQVLLNLLNNAKDALSETSDSQRYIHITLSQKNHENTLLFCDNGGGIEPTVLPKIFEPYVSTKSQKGGTGIGLYISHLIMEQKLGGSIDVHNHEKGACFTLRFPSA
ncbi:MAG: CBS domain-containing protein [Campylobacterota bacterium]|nr:CBS domain-containing protein [Campylobacterota bacterium]